MGRDCGGNSHWRHGDVRRLRKPGGHLKKASVYTRTGDGGTSQLLSAGRVAKSHPRLAAYGDCDELNSVIGVAMAQSLAESLPAQLLEIQADLFVLGSRIAVPEPDKVGFEIPALDSGHSEKLEAWIDALDAQIEPLKNFILPGGSLGAAHLHHARAVCRRCERQIQRVIESEEKPLPPAVLTYINRLSDYLFTAARYQNRQAGVDDVAWLSGR